MTDALFDLAGDAKIKEALDELQRVPGWPYDPVKDEAFVRELQRQFPALALVPEIRAWAAWMLDHETKKKVRHRARLQTWCSRSVDYARERTSRTGVRATGSGASRVGASARPADAFGSESGRLERW